MPEVRGSKKTGAIITFEDIQAGQEARALCRSTCDLTARKGYSKDFALRDRSRRAAASIMADIAEGFDARSNQEFRRFLHRSLRSASELQRHLSVALDHQSCPRLGEFEDLDEQTKRVKALGYSLISYPRTHNKPRTSNVEPS